MIRSNDNITHFKIKVTHIKMFIVLYLLKFNIQNLDIYHNIIQRTLVA